MPIRIAKGKIILHREGKRIVVRDGVSFDFTTDEIAQINMVNAGALRKPIVQVPESMRAQVESQLENSAADLGKTVSGNNEGANETKPAAAAAQGNARGNRGGRAQAAAEAEKPNDDDVL